MTKLNEYIQRDEQFIAALIELKSRNDIGRLAELRRGLSKTTHQQAWQALQSIGGRIDSIVDLTIAGLFSLHPEHKEGGNLGTMWRELRRDAYNLIPSADKNRGSFEHRFNRLLTCSTKEELCERLRPFIALAKSKGMPIDYTSLYCDIKLWEHGESKLRWARQYWQSKSVKQSTDLLNPIKESAEEGL